MHSYTCILIKYNKLLLYLNKTKHKNKNLIMTIKNDIHEIIHKFQFIIFS